MHVLLTHFLEWVCVCFNKGNLTFGVLHLPINAPPAASVSGQASGTTGRASLSLGNKTPGLLVFEGERNLKPITM